MIEGGSLSVPAKISVSDYTPIIVKNYQNVTTVSLAQVMYTVSKYGRKNDYSVQSN